MGRRRPHDVAPSLEGTSVLMRAEQPDAVPVPGCQCSTCATWRAKDHVDARARHAPRVQTTTVRPSDERWLAVSSWVDRWRK